MVDVATGTTSPASGRSSVWKPLALGSVLLALGVAGGSIAILFQITSLALFVPLLFGGAIIQAWLALGSATWVDFVLHLFASAIDAALGYFVLADPLHGPADLLVVIGALLMVAGAIRIIGAMAARPAHRVWATLAGAAAILLGIAVWSEQPSAELWFVGLCIAIDFACRGTSRIVIALAEHKPAPGVDDPYPLQRAEVQAPK